MRIVAERDALATALTNAGRASLKSRETPRIVLTATADRIKATGQDPDLTIDTSIAADVLEPGTLIVPAKLTTDIVKALGSDEVSLEADDSTVTIRGGRAKFEVRKLEPTWFSDDSIFKDDEATSTTLPAVSLDEALRQVIPAALQDDSRAPQLTGVLFEPTENGVRLVATDSYRLAIRDVEGLSLESGDPVLIPARALAEVRRLLSDDEETLTFARTEHAAAFSLGASRVTTRLLAGAFPEYRRLLPAEYPCTFTANRAELSDAIKRVRVMAKDAATTPVRFNFGPAGVTLSIASAEMGSSSEGVDGKVEGDAPEVVAFNSRYLADALEAMTGSDVRIQVIDHAKPATFSGDDECRLLLMPVRTS